MPEILPSISQQSEMAAMICQLAPHEGHTSTLLDGVRLMRADGALGRTPCCTNQALLLSVRGTKEVTWPTGFTTTTHCTIWCCQYLCHFQARQMPVRQSLCLLCPFVWI